jgi:Tfp pilus assembly protein PilN
VIKVNLLESVTDQPAGVAFVEEKVSSTRTQTFLLALTVMALLVLGVGYDYVSTTTQHAAAVKELDKQRILNDQMNSVKREQADLERKLADINLRIDAIQKLRASQQGPSAVLSEIKARFDGVPGLYLKSVEQKEAEITIKGESPNEDSVTRFGQSMEFSSGMFTNLNIETQRETPQLKSLPSAPAVAPVIIDPKALKLEVVSFTIKASYAKQSPPQDGGGAAATAPATHVAAAGRN